MTVKKINIGIAGLGAISRVHIPILQSFNDVAVKAASEVDTNVLRTTGNKYGIAGLYTDYNKMYEDAVLDAVFVCLPNSLHYEAAKNALENNLHVFCEKPVGTSTKHAKDLVQTARKRNLILSAGYNRRLGANYQQAAGIVRGGTLGKILHVHAVLVNPGPYIAWRPSTNWLISGKDGVLYDTGCHLFDLIMYVLNDRIVEISSEPMITTGMDVIDNIAGIFKTEKGIVGTFSVGWRTAIIRDFIEIYGTGGSLFASPFEMDTFYGTCGPLDMISSKLCNIKRIIGILISRMGKDNVDETYIREDRAFIDAIIHNKSPSVSGEDAIRVLEVLEMIKGSIFQKYYL